MTVVYRMLGKWDKWYKDIKRPSSFRYGHTVTYMLAADYLEGCETVEDWGCGAGAFRRLRKGAYHGIDGSKNPFVDTVADIREYRSSVDGIVMRHVIEHNYDWRRVLDNALASFNKKFCLIIFTPFSEDETKVIKDNKKHGVDVPDISFAKKDIEDRLTGLRWRMESIQTKTSYGMEHVYYIEKTDAKVAVLSATLGTIEEPREHAEQSVPYALYHYTDENFPPRHGSMAPRLQAKVPKLFGWQMAPGYDHYIWIDGAFEMTEPNAIQWLLDQCGDADIALFKHQKRGTVEEEVRRIQIGLWQGLNYLQTRYVREWIDEQMEELRADEEYVDDMLFNGGILVYKNTPDVQKMMKEWWYHLSRYTIQDQLALPYAVKKSGVKYNVIDKQVTLCPHFKYHKHK